MDSLGGKLDRKRLETLCHYLSEEANERNSYKFNRDQWHFSDTINVRMQRNNADCGVFALMFAEYAARDAKIEFTQSDMPRLRRRIGLEILQSALIERPVSSPSETNSARA